MDKSNSIVDKDVSLFKDIETAHAKYVREKINEQLKHFQNDFRKINEKIHILNEKLKENITPYEKNLLKNRLNQYFNSEKQLQRAYANMKKDKDNIYICCSRYLRNFLLEMGSKLKHAMPEIELEDIYIALILVAYSMLGEQYYDMIKIRNITKDTEKVFFGLSSGDIIYNGENLSSKLRQFFVSEDENVGLLGIDVGFSKLTISNDSNKPPETDTSAIPSHEKRKRETPSTSSTSSLPRSSPKKSKKRIASVSPRTYRSTKRQKIGGKKKLRQTRRKRET